MPDGVKTTRGSLVMILLPDFVAFERKIVRQTAMYRAGSGKKLTGSGIFYFQTG